MMNRKFRGQSLGHRERRSIRWVVAEHPGNRRDGIPVASGHWDTVEPVQCTEESDGFHVAPVHADDESVSSRQDLHQPLATGRELHGR